MDMRTFEMPEGLIIADILAAAESKTVSMCF